MPYSWARSLIHWPGGILMINEFGLDYVVHLLLLIFVGALWGGIIRIVRGKVLIGVLYILTGAFFGIGWIIDLINMLTKKNFANA